MDIYQLPKTIGAPATGNGYRARMLLSIARAIEEARRSPCAKSRRGAATISTIAEDEAGPFAAHNRPPSPFTCAGDAACRAACGQICNHAEERVVMLSLRHRAAEAPMLDVLHVEVGSDAEGKGLPLPFDREGKPKRPSCITCARTMQAQSVRLVWLWGVDGWRFWWSVDFLIETCAELGITPSRVRR